MRIPEKELAEKLVVIYAAINNYDWPTVERAAAELRGITATTKPEPGTALMNVQTSRGGNPWDFGVIRGDGQVDVYMQGGPSSTYIWEKVVDYQPARVISEQVWTYLNTKADEQTRDIQDLSVVLDLWKAKGVYAEARVSELRAELAGANETLCEMMPAEPVELSVEEVGELFDTARGDDWLSWDSWTDTAQGIFAATVNAAIAKHVHGRSM